MPCLIKLNLQLRPVSREIQLSFRKVTECVHLRKNLGNQRNPGMRIFVRVHDLMYMYDIHSNSNQLGSIRRFLLLNFATKFIFSNSHQIF